MNDLIYLFVQKSRKLLQFHFTEWPGHTCPFPTALLDFRRRVRQIIDQSPEYAKGQMLVHCSEGGGRSGVFCQVDAQLELLEEDGLLDIFGYLKKLKASRKGMLENVVSFKMLHVQYQYIRSMKYFNVIWFRNN